MSKLRERSILGTLEHFKKGTDVGPLLSHGNGVPAAMFMKSFWKRMTSLLLTSAVLVSFCPESVSAGESVARSLNANSYASVVDNKQWNLGANSYGIDAESAWERNLHGEGIRIGLIDSGV